MAVFGPIKGLNNQHRVHPETITNTTIQFYQRTLFFATLYTTFLLPLFGHHLRHLFVTSSPTSSKSSLRLSPNTHPYDPPSSSVISLVRRSMSGEPFVYLPLLITDQSSLMISYTHLSLSICHHAQACKRKIELRQVRHEKNLSCFVSEH